AAREMESGKVLYRDLFDVKPPGIFWTYRAVRAVVGGSYRAVVAADLALTVLTLALLWAAYRREVPDGPLAAGLWLAGTGFAFMYFAGNLGVLQCETLANALTAGALYLTLARGSSGAGVGVLAGLGVLVKYFPGPVILAVAVVHVPAERRAGFLARACVAAAAV